MKRTHPPSKNKSIKDKARQAAQERRNDRISPDSIKKCQVRVRGFSLEDKVCGLCSFQEECKLQTCKRYMFAIEDLNRNIFTEEIWGEDYYSLQPVHYEPEHYKRLLILNTWEAIKEGSGRYHPSGGFNESIFDNWRDEIKTGMNKFIGEYFESGLDVNIRVAKKLNPATSNTLLNIVPEWNEVIMFLQEEEAKNVLRKYCAANNIVEYDGEPIEDVIEKENPLTLNLRQKLIKEYKEDVMKKMSLLDEVYQEERKKDEDKWPTTWMLNTEKIMDNLNKWEHAIPILNYLWRNKKSLMESKEISLAGISDYNNRCNVLIAIDRDEMTNELEISPSAAYNYIKEFTRWGILNKHKKHGSERLMVYSIGYYVESKEYGPRAYPFLKNSKQYRRALVEFNPYGKK